MLATGLACYNKNMNLVGHPRKKELWARLQESQPDMARVISEITKGFQGEYKMIEITKPEQGKPVDNIWEKA